MPYLRAALLRKKKQEQEEEIFRPPVIPVEPEEEPDLELEEPDNPELITTLLNVIDEKVHIPQSNETPDENVHAAENVSDTDNLQEIQEEKSLEQETGPEEIIGEVQETQEIILPSEPEPEQEISQELPEPEQELPEQEQTQETSQDLPDQEQEISQELQEQEETLQTEAETIETPATDDFDENSLFDSDDNDDVSDVKPEPEPEEIEPTQDEEPEPDEFKLQYDFTSGERYVDKVSTKTEFDKMLDELGAISKDLLSWQVEKFAKQYTEKFQDEGDKSEADAKKYEAFLGGYITNAAMILDDNGYRDIAIKQLDQAKSILEARKRLEEERQAIIARVEEQNDIVDLSDILGLFGDA